MSSFKLAPMTKAFWVLTALLLPLPLILAGVALVSGGPDAPVLLAAAAFCAAIYGGIWLYMRPSHFDIGEHTLRIVWPMRTRTLSRKEIAGAKILDRKGFWAEFGVPIRVGAGGLWGGFGLLWTHRRGWVSFYLSRGDGMVVVDRVARSPLLITPERPEEFVRELTGRP